MYVSILAGSRDDTPAAAPRDVASDFRAAPGWPTMRVAPSALPISAIVICQDEERTISACLSSVAACREIIVVDSGSTDGTLATIGQHQAAGLPIILIHQPWLGFAKQKQFALRHATQPWCLSLDADETLDEGLRHSMPRLIARADVAGWRLRRRPAANGVLGPPARGVYAKPILRLVRREEAFFDETALVHEGLIVSGRLRTARAGFIRHAPRLALPDQIAKEIRYARLKSAQRVAQGARPRRAKLFFNPFLYFLRLYVLHRWFLCGRSGFVHAMTAAIYSFMTEALHFDLDREAVRGSSNECGAARLDRERLTPCAPPPH